METTKYLRATISFSVVMTHRLVSDRYMNGDACLIIKEGSDAHKLLLMAQDGDLDAFKQVYKLAKKQSYHKHHGRAFFHWSRMVVSGKARHNFVVKYKDIRVKFDSTYSRSLKHFPYAI